MGVIIMKKTVVISLAVLVLAGALIFGASNVQAATQTNPFQTIVDRIAQKFGLKQADVQQVFDDVKNENQANAEKKYENMLATAVKNGKITDAEKSLILNKHKELIALRSQKQNATPTLTPQQRKDAMQKQKDDLTAWAKENNIDVKYLFGGFGMMGGKRGGMMGRGWGMGGKWATPTP